jgi:hypothetical protein
MFEGARLKIERANKHISDLNDVLFAFLNTDFHSDFRIEKDANTGNIVLKFSQTKEPPTDIPLILGDAIHNLRSALDLAYCEIIRDIANVPLRPKTQVRIAETREKVISDLTTGDGILKGSPGIAAVITDILKPYKAGNESNPIHAIHDLNITDKHIILIPLINATSAVVDATVRGTDGKHGSMVMRNCHVSVSNGHVSNIVAFAQGEYDLQYDVKAVSFTVLFGEGQPLEGQPIVPTLYQLSEFVAETLTLLEKSLGSPHSSAALAIGYNPPMAKKDKQDDQP